MSTPLGSNIPTPKPPRNDPITTRELALHDGSDPSKPIWVAVKGVVFDVTRNKDAYGVTHALACIHMLTTCSSWKGVQCVCGTGCV